MKEIFNRKKELIERAPLYYELSETFNKIIKSRIDREKKSFDKVVKGKTYLIDLAKYQDSPEDDPILEEMKKLDPVLLGGMYRSNIDEYKHNPKRYPEIYEFLKSLDWKPESIEESVFIRKYDNFIERHQAKYPDHWKFFSLQGELSYKWHVLLELNPELSIKPYTNDEIVWVGSPPSNKYTTHNASVHFP